MIKVKKYIGKNVLICSNCENEIIPNNHFLDVDEKNIYCSDCGMLVIMAAVFGAVGVKNIEEVGDEQGGKE